MTLFRTVRRTVLSAAVVSAAALATPSFAQAAPLPPACQEALLGTLGKFPVQYFTVPDRVQSTMLDEVAVLSEADQAEFTEAACAAWNGWATTNGAAVGNDLDTRYQNTTGLVCNKFAKSALGTIKKYAPNIPAATRGLERVAKSVWQNSMQRLSVEGTNATCRQAYDTAKAGW
ncbi:hypothetical protein [Streptomyces sp. B1I3]|uniref:hypothetical protein n=1 Tax=Streptomyces sp. B1I3 TaxID=3042264 RepID=UPI002783C8C6|nr:hypothetical protein [Streptomyces sp. B1I3]MDQ0792385.1 hypothetical protein [Streptomyces sp. B1I3]